ncbi:Fcf1-domain-containing protein [Schizophyllum commune]
MRQKRAKSYRKLMSLYHINFGFRQPYQILVDADMCKAAIDNKMDLHKQLEMVLQGDVKPMITQCCIHSLYLEGKSMQPAVDLAKTFERRKCNHREAIPTDECLAAVIGPTNKHRYAVATQSQPLRVKLRAMPAVPLVHINRAVMILEPPSDATLRQKELLVATSLKPSAQDASLASKPSTSKEEPPKKKHKGPKGPNPLSVKKKQKGTDAALKGKKPEEGAKAGEKRKRSQEDDDHAEGGHAKVDIITGDDGEAGQSSGRKRKRKRKTGGGDGTAGGGEVTAMEVA